MKLKNITKDFTKGEWWLKLTITAIMTIPIYLLITWIMNLLSSFSNLLSILLTGLFATTFFYFAIAYRKGNENFLKTIPRMILVLMVLQVIGVLIPGLSGLLTFTTANLFASLTDVALFLGVFYLSEAVASKIG